jgi:hypothetical protein
VLPTPVIGAGNVSAAGGGGDEDAAGGGGDEDAALEYDGGGVDGVAAAETTA